jgi:two-component sensor histidine kinase
MQHRVANSLQIIASILLLKARTVQSEEIRLHLHDAHQRVMSVATVQQQLHASGLNESIEIGPYLSKLCDSLAKSMVGERRPLSIKMQATSGAATSSEAVSLGLIVTELVINALKHGFPGGETGEILVSYDARASGWRLLVSDNGVGPGGESAEKPHIGLGTSTLLRRWHINSTLWSRNPVVPRGLPSQLLRAQPARLRVRSGSRLLVEVLPGAILSVPVLAITKIHLRPGSAAGRLWTLSGGIRIIHLRVIGRSRRMAGVSRPTRRRVDKLRFPKSPRRRHIKRAVFESTASPPQGSRVQFQPFIEAVLQLGGRRVTCVFKTSSETCVRSAAKRSL